MAPFCLTCLICHLFVLQALTTTRMEFEALEDEANAIHGDLWEQLNAGVQVKKFSLGCPLTWAVTCLGSGFVPICIVQPTKTNDVENNILFSRVNWCEGTSRKSFGGSRTYWRGCTRITHPEAQTQPSTEVNVQCFFIRYHALSNTCQSPMTSFSFFLRSGQRCIRLF